MVSGSQLMMGKGWLYFRWLLMKVGGKVQGEIE